MVLWRNKKNISTFLLKKNNKKTKKKKKKEKNNIIWCYGNTAFPDSILYKSIAGRYRPVSYPDGPITARYKFVKNAYWVRMVSSKSYREAGGGVGWGGRKFILLLPNLHPRF